MLVYAILILFISSRPSLGLPRIDIPDKLIHFCEYLLLGMLVFRLLTRDYHLSGARLWVTHVGGIMLFALGDEFLQSFIPGRDSDVWDWVADVGGGSLGAFCYCIIRLAWDRIKGRANHDDV